MKGKISNNLKAILKDKNGRVKLQENLHKEDPGVIEVKDKKYKIVKKEYLLASERQASIRP